MYADLFMQRALSGLRGSVPSLRGSAWSLMQCWRILLSHRHTIMNTNQACPKPEITHQPDMSTVP
jgi:hypothetical protein